MLSISCCARQKFDLASAERFSAPIADPISHSEAGLSRRRSSFWGALHSIWKIEERVYAGGKELRFSFLMLRLDCAIEDFARCAISHLNSFAQHSQIADLTRNALGLPSQSKIGSREAIHLPESRSISKSSLRPGSSLLL